MPVSVNSRPFTIFKRSFLATITLEVLLALVIGCQTTGRSQLASIPTVTSPLVDLLFTPSSGMPVRRDAKTTMATGTAVTYTSITAVTTETDGTAGLTRTSPRTDVENKLASFDAYLYAYNKPADNDFHLIIGDTQTFTAGTTHLINIEISGRPDSADITFKAVRQAFINILSHKLLAFPTAAYKCVPSGTLVHLTVIGGPFWDIGHSSTHTSACGAQLQTPNSWEIHPVTSIALK